MSFPDVKFDIGAKRFEPGPARGRQTYRPTRTDGEDERQQSTAERMIDQVGSAKADLDVADRNSEMIGAIVGWR